MTSLVCRQPRWSFQPCMELPTQNRLNRTACKAYPIALYHRCLDNGTPRPCIRLSNGRHMSNRAAIDNGAGSYAHAIVWNNVLRMVLVECPSVIQCATVRTTWKCSGASILRSTYMRARSVGESGRGASRRFVRKWSAANREGMVVRVMSSFRSPITFSSRITKRSGSASSTSAAKRGKRRFTDAHARLTFSHAYTTASSGRRTLRWTWTTVSAVPLKMLSQ